MSGFRLFISVLSVSSFLSTAVLAQSAAPADDNAPVTRAQLPALIKEILLKDTSILIEVAEKMQADQEKEMTGKAKEVISKRKDDLFNDASSPVAGDPKGDVTVVEFFDYHCGYCRQALASIKELMEKDKKVKVVFKEYPILGEDSKTASKAALAVNRIAKDKYFAFHQALFAVKGSFSQDVVVAEAKKLGIDAEKLKAEMAKPEIEEILKKNSELGLAMGARGTPAIIIGDGFYPGAIPYEMMKKAVDETRSGGKK